MFIGINLAIDPVSVAVIDDKKTLVEKTVHKSYGFSENLIDHIENLLTECCCQFDQLKGIAAAIGPGSYTGLRLSATTAKTMAQFLKIPVYGISTLEAIAYQNRFYNQLVFSCIRARKNELNLALFGITDQVISRKTDDMVLSNEIFLKKLDLFEKPITIMGSLPENLIPELKARNMNVLNQNLRASVIAEMGRSLFQQAAPGDYKTLMPLYSHAALTGQLKKHNTQA